MSNSYKSKADPYFKYSNTIWLISYVVVGGLNEPKYSNTG